MFEPSNTPIKYVLATNGKRYLLLKFLALSSEPVLYKKAASSEEILNLALYFKAKIVSFKKLVKYSVKIHERLKERERLDNEARIKREAEAKAILEGRV